VHQPLLKNASWDIRALIEQSGFYEWVSINKRARGAHRGANFSWTAALWLAWHRRGNAVSELRGRTKNGVTIQLEAVEKWFGNVQVIKSIDLEIPMTAICHLLVA